MLKKFFQIESGQSMVLFALFIVVLVGFAGLAIDGGRLYNSKSKLQKAADAAALAGVQDLPNASTAKSTAKNYAIENEVIESEINSIHSPYLEDPNKIEVNLTGNVSFTFGRVFGLEKTDVSARAVAQKYDRVLDSGPFDYAVFSGDGAVTFNGNDHKVVGNVYGKTGIYMKHTDITGKAVSAGHNIDVPSGVTKIKNTTVPFPTNLPDLIKAKGTKLTNNKIDGERSLNGIYYIDGDLTINGRIKGTAIIYASGNITFASGFEQKDTDSVMFYTNGSFTFNGGSGDVYGILYAPNGSFTHNGGPNGAVYGRIITKDSITNTGAKFSVTSSSNDLEGLKLLKDPSYKLVE